MSVTIRPRFPNLGTVNDRFVTIQNRIRRNRPLMETMGRYMVSRVQSHFNEGGVDGVAWAKLSPLTVENRIGTFREKERIKVVKRRESAQRRQIRGATLIGPERHILAQRGNLRLGIKAKARLAIRKAQLFRGAKTSSTVPSHLTNTGKLWASIRSEVRQRGAGAGTVVVFTNDPRAAALSHGGSWTREPIEARAGKRLVFYDGGRHVKQAVGAANITLPPRPFMVITSTDREVLDRMVWAEMTAAVSGTT